MPNFLIIKTSAIGDIIQTFPVVSYLKERHPSARIDWVVEEAYAPLIEAHPDIDQVFAIQTQKWRRSLYLSPDVPAFRRQLREKKYTAIFDLQGNAKSALFTAMATGPKIGFGWKTVPEKANCLATSLRFNPPSDVPIQMRYLSIVQSYFGDREPFQFQEVVLNLSESEMRQLKIFEQGKNRILVAFGSKWPNKRLPTETLKAFLEEIEDEPVFYFIGGSPEELEEARALTAHFAPRAVLVGKVSLPLLQAVMRQMSLVIAMDSAALHLCGTTNTPSFSIFGPSLASIYKPLGEHHTHLQGACPYGKVFERRCPILRTCTTGACIRNLSVEEIKTAGRGCRKT